MKAYAHDLKDWFASLNRHGLDWRAVTLEDVAGYVAWLRLPPAARDGRVVALPMRIGHVGVEGVADGVTDRVGLVGLTRHTLAWWRGEAGDPAGAAVVVE